MAKKPNNKRYYTKAIRCPDGSRKYIRGKTKAELERKVREAQAQLSMGININNNITVFEFAQTWMDVYKRPHLKPGTVERLLRMLNLHIIPVIGAMKVREVTPADCAKVMAKAGHLANSTQSDLRTRLKELLQCAVENGIISRNPVTKSVRPSGKPKKERVPLTAEQVNELCHICMTHWNPRLYTFVMLCGFAGLRESEALGLNMRNVDLDTGILHVREQYFCFEGKGGTTPVLKTTAAHRNIPMPPVLLAHLSSLTDLRADGYLFDVDNKNLQVRFCAQLKNVCSVDRDGNPRRSGDGTPIEKPRGEKVDFYVFPHLLRHTYATRCFEGGLDVKEVQYLMGHTSPKMTMEIYIHYTEQVRQRDTAKKIDQAFQSTHLVAVGQNGL